MSGGPRRAPALLARLARQARAREARARVAATTRVIRAHLARPSEGVAWLVRLVVGVAIVVAVLVWLLRRYAPPLEP